MKIVPWRRSKSFRYRSYNKKKFTSKGYDAKQLFKLEIYFNQFTFLIDNKDNKLPLAINFIEGKFAGWVKK